MTTFTGVVKLDQGAPEDAPPGSGDKAVPHAAGAGRPARRVAGEVVRPVHLDSHTHRARRTNQKTFAENGALSGAPQSSSWKSDQLPRSDHLQEASTRASYLRHAKLKSVKSGTDLKTDVAAGERDVQREQAAGGALLQRMSQAQPPQRP